MTSPITDSSTTEEIHSNDTKKGRGQVCKRDNSRLGTRMTRNAHARKATEVVCHYLLKPHQKLTVPSSALANTLVRIHARC